MMLDQKKLSGTTRELLYDQNLPVPLSYSKSVFTEAAQDDTWQILLTAHWQGENPDYADAQRHDHGQPLPMGER